MPANIKIECPKCGWEPDGGAHWMCTCGHIWNTFATAARCPACGKQWEYTSCIPHMGGCDAMPPHVDWYKGLDEWLNEALTESVQLEELAGSKEPGKLLPEGMAPALDPPGIDLCSGPLLQCAPNRIPATVK